MKRYALTTTGADGKTRRRGFVTRKARDDALLLAYVLYHRARAATLADPGGYATTVLNPRGPKASA